MRGPSGTSRLPTWASILGIAQGRLRPSRDGAFLPFFAHAGKRTPLTCSVGRTRDAGPVCLLGRDVRLPVRQALSTASQKDPNGMVRPDHPLTDREEPFDHFHGVDV